MAKKPEAAKKPAAKPKAEPKAKPAAAAPATDSVAEKISKPVKKAAAAVKDSAERAVKRGVVLNSKVIDHAETNTQKVFAAMRAATQAGSMSEIAKIQTKFVRDQTERSVAQAREMGEMIAKFGRDAVDKIRKK